MSVISLRVLEPRLGNRRTVNMADTKPKPDADKKLTKKDKKKAEEKEKEMVGDLLLSY